MPRRWYAGPHRARGEPLTLHEERECVQPRTLLHLSVVEDHRDRPHRAVGAYTELGRLQDSVLEKMGLDDAVFVQSSPVADLDEIELEKAGGLYVSSASDPRAEQPEVPGEQGRSQQGFERERPPVSK
jgi:hypothetical protein